MKFVLASKSPRRKEILQNIGLKFDVICSDADENCSITDPRKYAEEVANRKAKAVYNHLKDMDIDADTLIIAADTSVVCKNEILGKPLDKNDARRMLSLLSGSTHEVISGISLIFGGRICSASEVTTVTFDEMSAEDIEYLVNSDEPYDKAGAYAIQGLTSMWIRGIGGDYFNVVGLPVNLLCRLAKSEFGIDFTKESKEHIAQ